MKRKDGSVEVVFIPWHRRASHSLTLGIIFALLGWMLASLLHWVPGKEWVVGAVIFLAWLMHVILDTFGHMGINLFWPVTKHRTSGLYLVSAANPFWNAFVNYSCVALILWNLNSYNAEVSASYTVPWLAAVPVWLYLFVGVVIPWVILGAVYIIYEARVKEKRHEAVAPMTGAVARVAVEPAGMLEQEPEIAERPNPRCGCAYLALRYWA